MSIIKLKNVSKFYHNKNSIASGFNKISLEFSMGEFIVITGESGSGKSTLLNVISGLDSYEEGEMYINGEETSHYSEVDYELYRRKYVGNIFQNFNLINSYTVYQNIELVLLFNGYKTNEIKRQVLDIIKKVGLTKYRRTKVSKLSGGQKQRVAIARALAQDTPVIVADEPTGNLDIKSAKEVIGLLDRVSKNKLVIIVTHNYEQFEKYATRKITMHDGRIIEDKKIKDVEEANINTAEYKSITFFNKFKLALRNVFNIKVKFLLLIFVYLFLSIAVFAEYSSIRKINYDQYDNGYNYYFRNVDTNRVILNKKDKTPFTDTELNNLRSTPNINYVIENDIILDVDYSLYNDDIYISGTVDPVTNIENVDLGRLPLNDNEVIISANKNSYYITDFGDKLLNMEYSIQNNYNGLSVGEKFKICGIKYSKDDTDIYGNDIKLYFPSKLLEEIRKFENNSYSNISLSINNRIISNDTHNTYFQLKPNKYILKGKALVSQDLNSFCKNYDCRNDSMNIKIKNMYYEENINVKIKDFTTSENFKKLTGLSNYEEERNTIYISQEDYDQLFLKDTYQISVFLNDNKTLNETLNTLNDMGYKTISMRNIIVNELGDFVGILKIIRGVVSIISLILLFFLSYFIIKVILKARNIYFSTIRILGATKKQAKDLLTIELLIDINIAFLIFMGAIILVKMGIVNSEFIKDMVTFFKLYDYIFIYLILCFMSFLISNRFAHKLFKNSVMKTYREEV